MINRRTEQIIQEIKLDLENYNNLSDKDREIIISIIDQKISDLRVILFNHLSHDYDDLQRLARTIKGIVRTALAKEYTNTTSIALDILGGLTAVVGGVAAGGGLIVGGAGGNLALKLGKLGMSGSQGIGLFAKVPENFSQAERVVKNDDLDTAKNEISNDEEGKRESRQTYNRILQAKNDQNSRDNSAKREMMGRS